VFDIDEEIDLAPGERGVGIVDMAEISGNQSKEIGRLRERIAP